jgi:hypothetical protein
MFEKVNQHTKNTPFPAAIPPSTVFLYVNTSICALLQPATMPKSKRKVKIAGMQKTQGKQRAARASGRGVRDVESVETPNTSAEGELRSSWPWTLPSAALCANLQQPVLTLPLHASH